MFPDRGETLDQCRRATSFTQFATGDHFRQRTNTLQVVTVTSTNHPSREGAAKGNLFSRARRRRMRLTMAFTVSGAENQCADTRRHQRRDSYMRRPACIVAVAAVDDALRGKEQ